MWGVSTSGTREVGRECEFSEMISFNNIFSQQPGQPASKVAGDGLKALRTTSESAAQHEIADGYLKTVAKTGLPDEAIFAKTVRAASAKLNLEYQQAAIEKLGLEMLAGGMLHFNPAGLALAHFGKQAYEILRNAPRGDNAKANAAAARIMQGIEEDSPRNSNAALLAELGQKVTKKADGVGNVVSQVFDSVLDSQGESPEVAIAQYGLKAGTSGYYHDPERVTGPVLDFLIAHSDSSLAVQDGKAAKRAAEAGAGYQAASVHQQAFQDIVDWQKPPQR